MRPTSLLIVGVAFTLAGCLGGATKAPGNEAPNVSTGPKALMPFTVPDPKFDFSKIVDPNHAAHSVPTLHSAFHGVKLAGQTAIQPILPQGMRGSITSIDVLNGYAVVAGLENGPAFVIVDIHDPAHPKPISYYPTVADGWTARFSKVDGDYVFYGCQVTTGANPSPQTKGDCSDPNGPPHPGTQAQSSINVYDVRDKAHPKFVDSLPATGSHNLQTAKINGIDVVVDATGEIITFDRTAGKLHKVAQEPGVHDATVSKHPITGDWLMYTGSRAGSGGPLGASSFSIYNINDPANPEVVLEGGQFQVDGWHEQTAFPTLVDGRALLAVAGEDSQAASGLPDFITLLDISDPAHPVKLSQWQPPFTPTGPYFEYQFSAHEIAVTPQGQLASCWYHGGAWVIDVSTKERQAHPVTVAAYQAHENINDVPAEYFQLPEPMVPNCWAPNWDSRGYMVIPDMDTGVYVLEPDWGLVPMTDGGE